MSARRLLVLVVAAMLGAGACGGGTPARRASPTPQQGGGAQAGGAATPRVAWTHDELLRRIAGRRIVVGGRTVGIDPDTVVCGGVGRPTAQRDGHPAWSSFRCLQPTFPPGVVVGPDAVFFVEPTGARAFRIAGARLTHY